MATIINLEGFPKVASEAIEFSYFLSESEKAEWREWLKTATPEQQEELVDILYSMWQDNQKNAVPENLANNQNLNPQAAPVQAAPISPAPIAPVAQAPSFTATQPQTFPGFNPQPAPTFGNTNNNFAPNPVQNPISQPSFGNQPASQPFAATPQAPAPLPQIPSFTPSVPAFNPQPATIPDFNQQFSGTDFNFNNQNNTQVSPAPALNQNIATPPLTPELVPQPVLPPKLDTTIATENPSFVPNNDDFSPQNSDFTTFPTQTIDYSQNLVANNFVSATPVPAPVEPFKSTITEPPVIEKTEVEEPKIEPKIPEPTIAPAPEITSAPDTSQNINTSFDFEDELESEKPETEAKKSNDINMESLVNDNKYRPNPILNDNSETDSEFIFKNNSEPKNIEKAKPASPKPTQSKTDKDSDQDNQDFEFNPVQPPKDTNKNPKPNPNKSNNKKDQVIQFNNLKDPGTKDMLNEIYNDYIETYDTNQKKFVVFLDRVTKVLSNYETISGHFENLTGKVVDINDKMVSQARDIQALKDATRTQAGTSIQEQIDDIRFDLDNLEKDVRSLRTESRRKTSEISQQMAAVGADSYGDGGVIQKIELLKSEINNLKHEMTANKVDNNVNSGNNIPTKTSKLDLTGII